MKHYLIIARVAVLAYFVVAAIQQKVMPIPLVGNMLPR